MRCVSFLALAATVSAAPCARTTCTYEPLAEGLFRTTIHSSQQPDPENFACGSTGVGNDCACSCDDSFTCTLNHVGGPAGASASIHHCDPLVTPVPDDASSQFLYALKSRGGSTLRSEWSSLQSDTKDSELAALSLRGVTLDGDHLKELYCYGRDISGTIPSLAHLKSLTKINIAGNKFIGTVPSVSSNTELLEFNAYDNTLTGTLPSFDLNTKLTKLTLAENELTGTLPTFDANPELIGIWMSVNEFTGTLPNFTNQQKLQYLYLYDNNLTGPIPNLSHTNLEMLQIQMNTFSNSPPRSNYPADIRDIKVWNK